MVLQARGETPAEARAGWERLARAYWKPLYAYLRRRGADHHSAADDVQGFFAHMLSQDFLRRIERGDGLFRAFLLASFTHWRTDQYRAAQARKRGGGQAPLQLEEIEAVGAAPPAPSASPEEAFDRRWARAVYDHALATLEERLRARGREALYRQLNGLFTGRDVAKYREIAAALDMGEGAVKQAVLELRREFGLVLREEIARTVADPGQVDGELRYLLGLLR
ncbi:MAG: hypothetical protein JSR82_12790 [Verrucomicrobia bacterium]|nr:hypothetical protein [Verrucomicrobiota bacterium]